MIDKFEKVMDFIYKFVYFVGKLKLSHYFAIKIKFKYFRVPNTNVGQNKRLGTK